MFILTNVYPALVIKMLQMDGKGRGADDVVPYLTVAPLSRVRQLMHITAEPSLVLCTLMPASENYLPSDIIRVGFALCYKHTETGNLQTLLCFIILMSSLSFNFLFIIKKTQPQLIFLSGSYLNKAMQTLSFNFFYLLPIV